MKLAPQLIVAAAILCLACAACDAVNFASANSPTLVSNQVLFQDDFADASGGWSTLNTADRYIGIQDGALRILVNEAKFDLWSTPGLKFTDAHIDVDATQNAGPDDNDFGVICRYQDENNFYGFLISSDGYYGISKMKNGEHAIIGAPGMLVSASLQKAGKTNHIRADCVGQTLSLSVNGQKLMDVQDANFAEGDIGLVAGTFETPGTDVSFKNLSVTK
jgi:hypothetical protein